MRIVNTIVLCLVPFALFALDGVAVRTIPVLVSSLLIAAALSACHFGPRRFAAQSALAAILLSVTGAGLVVITGASFIPWLALCAIGCVGAGAALYTQATAATADAQVPAAAKS